MYISPAAIENFELDEKKVKSCARRIEKAVKELNEMDCILFGGHEGGSGTIHYRGHMTDNDVVIGDVEGIIDGGVGDDADNSFL